MPGRCQCLAGLRVSCSPQGRGPREIGGDAVTECRRLGLPAARQAVRTAGRRCNARARIRAL